MALDLPLAFAGLLSVGFVCQWLAWRVKLPAILPLLLAGILLGPVSGVLDPDALFGRLLFPLVSLSVAVVLFEGSLTLRLEEARGVGGAILRLVSVGILATVAVLAAAAHYLAALPWPLALVFGALVCVTGPTVVIPLLRSVRPNERVANVLRWEGILVDPIGALLAVLIFQAVVSELGPHSFKVFALSVLCGAGAGLAGAFVLGWLLRHHAIPDYLQNYCALALVLLVYAGANAVAHESGLLAVTMMGMVLANLPGVNIRDILDFKEHLSTLLISALFVLLAARLQRELPVATLWAGLSVLAVAQLVARPLAVLVSTTGSALVWRERALLAWVAPRGIVAAAVSALFGLRLRELGEPGAELLVPLTFLMIIGTVVVQSATARPLARWLGVAEPEPNGVLIVGSGALERGVAKALRDLKLPVLVADDDWDGVRAARMDGLRAFYGNPVSENADRNLDLMGLGNLFAMSKRRELNSLACVRYRPEFGRARVFSLRNVEGGSAGAEVTERLAAARLFGEQASYTTLSQKLREGWLIKTTRLGQDFGMKQFQAAHGGEVLPLFSLDDRGRLRVVASDRSFEPGPGWSITSLVPPEPAEPVRL